jgi:putative SOS response-associated peptidase YedK
MYGRITQSSPKRLGLGLTTINLVEPLYTYVPRYNGAPGQEHCVIRQNPKRASARSTGWPGPDPPLVQRCERRPQAGHAKAETVVSLPSFRDAYRRRRCLLPVDNFFEWKAIKGARAKQPYAIAMKSGEPFGLAAIWENWQRPGSEEWVRTFAVITTAANELVSEIHDRMPVIIPPVAYERWLSTTEHDQRDLLVPYPSEPMTIWPISTRINKPENDDEQVLDALERKEAGPL